MGFTDYEKDYEQEIYGEFDCEDNELMLEDVDDEITAGDWDEEAKIEADGYCSDILQVMIKQYSSFPLLSPEEERNLLNEYYITRDKKIREILELHNMRLCISMVFKFKPYLNKSGANLEDLIHEGYEGLNRAVEKFDPEKGGKLSTYATCWIKQKILKSCNSFMGGNAISLPDTAACEARKILRFSQRFEETHHREPSIEEIAKGTGLKSKHIQDIWQWNRGVSSLEYNVYGEDDEHAQLSDVIGNSESKDPTFNEARVVEVDEALNKAKDLLTLRELRCFDKVHGQNGEKVHTIDEVAEEQGVSKERIRQLLRSAYKKIRESDAFQKAGITADYLE